MRASDESSLRHLFTFPARTGMSDEKCVQFLDQYPTPASFFDDLDIRQAQGSTEAELISGGGKRSRKSKTSQPQHHVKSKVDTDMDHPRPMCETTSAKFWHLATAVSYMEC